MSRWYALKVFYNKVFDLRDTLAGRVDDTYIPVTVSVVERGGVKKRVERPLISSLMFIRATPEAAASLGPVIEGKAMIYTAMTAAGRHPVAIPDREMNIFMLVTSRGEWGVEYIGDDMTRYHSGDRVRVIDGPFKGSEGHIVRIVRPSDKREAPRCRHFTLCGGCKWQHLPYSEQLQWKQRQVEDALTRIAKVELPPVSEILGSESVWEYRNKMEYTFSDKKWRSWEELRSGREFTDSNDALGFHIPGAFDKVLHIEECHLQCNIGDEIRNFIYDYACSRGLTFYNIRENSGLLRTLMIRTASTGEVMVCVVFGDNDPERIKSVMHADRERFPGITSLLYVVNLKLNDSISDQDVIPFRGPDYIEEEMEGLRFRINAQIILSDQFAPGV